MKLTITAKRDGRRRAGRAWSKTPVTVDAGKLSKAQIEALKSDPMLVVVEAGDKNSNAADGKGNKKPDPKADDNRKP